MAACSSTPPVALPTDRACSNGLQTCRAGTLDTSSSPARSKVMTKSQPCRSSPSIPRGGCSGTGTFQSRNASMAPAFASAVGWRPALTPRNRPRPRQLRIALGHESPGRRIEGEEKNAESLHVRTHSSGSGRGPHAVLGVMLDGLSFDQEDHVLRDVGREIRDPLQVATHQEQLHRGPMVWGSSAM